MKLSLKATIAITLPLMFISLHAYSSKEMKYKAGDCITPTNPEYTWHGYYASVIAAGNVDGYSGDNYVLYFPKYKSRDVIFTRSIEKETKKVNSSYCK
ncbi:MULTISPECIES: hypothetical protein [Providencia]|uniref:hypothetical protein n=1 Tax=Providencia TaxID=586 RepID=UPI00234BCADB|nr:MULTISPECIES: hypothetical protein [unclassified Providencia]